MEGPGLGGSLAVLIRGGQLYIRLPESGPSSKSTTLESGAGPRTGEGWEMVLLQVLIVMKLFRKPAAVTLSRVQKRAFGLSSLLLVRKMHMTASMDFMHRAQSLSQRHAPGINHARCVGIFRI